MYKIEMIWVIYAISYVDYNDSQISYKYIESTTDNHSQMHNYSITQSSLSVIQRRIIFFESQLIAKDNSFPNHINLYILPGADIFQNNIIILNFFMGQKLITPDVTTRMSDRPPQSNVRFANRKVQLQVCPTIYVPISKVVYEAEKLGYREISYQFFQKRFVWLKLRHKSEQYENEGVQFSSTSVTVYGYKNKIKSADKIKRESLTNRTEFLLFKRRIYGKLEKTIRKFAEMKLLSILQVGPYVGKMTDGSDAHIKPNYIQFYGQVTLNTRNNSHNLDKIRQKITKQILEKGFNFVDREQSFEVAFSSYQKTHIIKLLDFQKQKIKAEETTHASLNTALTYLRKQYDEETHKTVLKIDEKTNMLSFIENQVIQKNIDKAIDAFEEVMTTMDDNEEKLKYAYQFCDILSDNKYFTEYEEQVISEVLATGQILKENLPQTPYGQKLEERLNNIRLKQSQFNSETELEQFSKSFSREDSSRTSFKSLKMQQLKINIQGNNRKRAEQIMGELKKIEKNGDLSKESDEEISLEIQFQYGTILMKSGKSRHALVLFETLNRYENTPKSLKYQMYNYMGLIYYYKYKYQLAVREFENCLNILLSLHCHSPMMMIAYNNIGCSYYRENKFDKSIEMFNRVIKCGQSSVDYEMMARSNKGMALLDKKMYKEAKHEFMLILRMIQPVNNASILCKVYSNLGYLNMIDNNFNEAITDFQIANRIEAICLIPNGYKPSLFLHNNIAMVYFKKKQYRKALAHIQKCKQHVEFLKDIEAMHINYNYAMIYQKLYFHEFALKHLNESRRFMYRLPENQRYLFDKKLEIQIEKLNSIRIIEDSEQSAHQSKSSRYSSAKKYI